MIIPSLPSQHYKTYQIIAPLSSHWRPASCEEVECEAWRNGWITRVPVGSPQAQYIRASGHGRRFQETTQINSTEAEFMFPSGQRCFASDKHRVPLERTPIYVARGGDARGNPTGERRVHASAEDWAEDFAEHQNKVKKSRGE